SPYRAHAPRHPVCAFGAATPPNSVGDCMKPGLNVVKAVQTLTGRGSAASASIYLGHFRLGEKGKTPANSCIAPDRLGDVDRPNFEHSSLRRHPMTTTWQELSKDISKAVEQAGKSIVAVDGRAGHTSSGIVWRRDSILTAAHAIRH